MAGDGGFDDAEAMIDLEALLDNPTAPDMPPTGVARIKAEPHGSHMPEADGDADQAMFRHLFAGGSDHESGSEQEGGEEEEEEGEEDDDESVEGHPAGQSAPTNSEANASCVAKPKVATVATAIGDTLDGGYCLLCHSKPSDPDLASSAPDATTSFQRVRPWTSAYGTVCDNCFTFVRFQLDGAPLSKVNKDLRAPAQLNHFLARLSCFLAMKRSDTTLKVHKQALLKAVSIMDAQQSIMATLRRRCGLKDHAEAPQTMQENAPCITMGLVDYVRRHGNPLIKKHPVHMALIQGAYTLVVQAPRGSDTGLHSLRDIATSQANEIRSAALADLALMSVDSLDVAKVVQSLVVEWACRENLNQQVQQLPNARPSIVAATRSSRSEVSAP